MRENIHCPSCGDRGKGIKPVTLESLLTASGLAEAGELDAYWHCPAPRCDVAYYGPASGQTLSKALVSVRIGTKETEGPRPVCYCFEHTWESIEDDLREAGTTEVVEIITAHCRKGEDRCPETNPQGSCCLGNVRRAIKEGKAKLHIVDEPGGPAPAAAAAPAPDCCAPAAADKTNTAAETRDCRASDSEAIVPAAVDPVRPSMADRSGLFAALGGLTVAVLSSACCWLPLLLIGIGTGTTSVAGFFEEYRTLLLLGTAGLLGAGFYFVYFRKEKCEPGSACEVPNPRLKRFNKVTLWVATAFAAVFAFFPNYIGVVLNATDGAGGSNVTAVAAGAPSDFVVEGMTCEACTVHIKDAVAMLPGTSAEVSYEEKLARVSQTNPSINDAMVVAAIAEAGYKAAPRGAVVSRFDVEGMTCESCVEHLEHAVGEVAGVNSVAVSYPEKLLVVVHDDGEVKAGDVAAAVKAAGYTATASE